MFPIKSLDGAAVESAEFTARGGLRHDRRYALVDAEGRYVNGKREPRVHAIRVVYDPSLEAGTFRDGASGDERYFRLDADRGDLAAWIGESVGRPVVIRCDDDGGFPDDELAPGPTIVSTATLTTVASWFPGLTVESVRRRLRTNIEIDGVPPFWEDTLYGAAGTELPFRVGGVAFAGTNPCQRCVVPTRDPDTGVALGAFAKHVAERRAATLPPWAARERFDHYYRLTVNTRVAGAAGRSVRIGDVVAVEAALA